MIIDRHTRHITRSQKYELDGITVRAVQKYDKIVKNIREFNSEFLYSAIVHTGDIDKNSSQIFERKVRKEASVKYPNRLYNSLSSEEEIVYLNYLVGQNNFIVSLTGPPRASNLIPPKSLAARTK